jgi:hypothetical protein
LASCFQNFIHVGISGRGKTQEKRRVAGKRSDASE